MEEFDEDGLCAKTETGRCYMVVVKGCWVEFYVYYQTAVGVGINGGNAFCPWGLLMGNRKGDGGRGICSMFVVMGGLLMRC